MSEQPAVAYDVLRPVVRPAACSVVRPADAGPLLELTGLAAHVHLGLFGLIGGLIGGHGGEAPTLASAQRLLAIGLRVGERQRLLLAVGEVHGVEPAELMAPFAGALGSFEARTAESTWWEGLLKGIVGYGVTSDLCRLLVRGLPEFQAIEVGAAMAHADDERAIAAVRAGVEADSRLASRLALWSRRVVGESLSLSQTLLVTRPALGALASAASSSDTALATRGATRRDAVPWVLAELTSKHTRRMDSMGLTA